MISNNDVAHISALDLNPIKKKLMHVESGEGWSLEQATAVEIEYRRFLYLMKTFPNAQVAPLEDVDTFWHYHILDTMKYARDCEEVFGYFLHHYPYVGMDEEGSTQERQDAGERMRELYESSFGVSYVPAEGVFGDRAPAGAVQTAWCTGTTGIKSDAAQTAWCTGKGGPGIAMLDKVQTAWCFGSGGPGIAKPADVQIAYCIGTGTGPGMVKSA